MRGISFTLLACLALSACGFKPLYGVDSATHRPAAMARFATIEIPVIPDRIGQQMRNMLIDDLHPNGAAGEYRYRLTVQVKEVDLNIGLQENATTTRGQVRITAQYWLVDNDTGTTLQHEVLRTSTGYNILINQFGSILSVDDAREKGLQQISDDITQHLALYFLNAK